MVVMPNVGNLEQFIGVEKSIHITGVMLTNYSDITMDKGIEYFRKGATVIEFGKEEFSCFITQIGAIEIISSIYFIIGYVVDETSNVGSFNHPSCGCGGERTINKE
ncbi:hypothetical protein ACTA71_010639 [Dictyostelium dimigraforme]